MNIAMPKPLKIAFISTYPPRQCGLATYTADLLDSINKMYQVNSKLKEETLLEVIALNKSQEQYSYSREVTFHIRDQHRGDYRRAADFINLSPIEVVSLQHEFGIFGGEDGNYILHLLASLNKPVVTTLHTVLRDPSPGQKQTLSRICQHSTLVVVQAGMAGKLLQEVYGVPESKITMIHHGAPDVPFLDPAYYKDQFQAEGKKVLLTFGLLSPSKGLEYAIEAMAEVVKEVPNALYIILGATHPEVKRVHGEQYRLSLEKLVRKLGLTKNVAFYNQYVTLEKLIQFLVATDIYITPYISQEQAVSGTLAYAIACGKAIISTPYWYAQEMLADGRGMLVPPRDSKALAAAIVELLLDEEKRNSMRKQAYQFGRQMIWKEVARKYAFAFDNARQNYCAQILTLPQEIAVTESSSLPEVNLKHLRNLTDDTGLFQHALYFVPDRRYGYCTDDNARALIAVLQNWRLHKDESTLGLIKTYLSFIHHALEAGKGRLLNFLSYQRQWLEEVGSEDCHGRGLWALGYAVANPPNQAVLSLASHLFRQAVGAPLTFSSPRAWAFSILGALYYLKHFGGDTEARNLVEQLSSRLFGKYKENAEPGWFWFEDIVTYDNARLPQALIAAGKYLDNEEMLEAGLQAREWLISIQTDPEHGYLSLVGNQGWYRKGGEKARFDQQPLDAAALVDACYGAYLATGEYRWIIAMDWSFNWFFGNNSAHQVLYDFSSGGCYDGLEPGGVNRNQGGESTVSMLMALQQMHLVANEEVMLRR